MTVRLSFRYIGDTAALARDIWRCLSSVSNGGNTYYEPKPPGVSMYLDYTSNIVCIMMLYNVMFWVIHFSSVLTSDPEKHLSEYPDYGSHRIINILFHCQYCTVSSPFAKLYSYNAVLYAR